MLILSQTRRQNKLKFKPNENIHSMKFLYKTNSSNDYDCKFRFCTPQISTSEARNVEKRVQAQLHTKRMYSVVVANKILAIATHCSTK